MLYNMSVPSICYQDVGRFHILKVVCVQRFFVIKGLKWANVLFVTGL